MAPMTPPLNGHTRAPLDYVLTQRPAAADTENHSSTPTDTSSRSPSPPIDSHLTSFNMVPTIHPRSPGADANMAERSEGGSGCLDERDEPEDLAKQGGPFTVDELQKRTPEKWGAPFTLKDLAENIRHQPEYIFDDKSPDANADLTERWGEGLLPCNTLGPCGMVKERTALDYKSQDSPSGSSAGPHRMAPDGIHNLNGPTIPTYHSKDRDIEVDLMEGLARRSTSDDGLNEAIVDSTAEKIHDSDEPPAWIVDYMVARMRSRIDGTEPPPCPPELVARQNSGEMIPLSEEAFSRPHNNGEKTAWGEMFDHAGSSLVQVSLIGGIIILCCVAAMIVWHIIARRKSSRRHAALQRKFVEATPEISQSSPAEDFSTAGNLSGSRVASSMNDPEKILGMSGAVEESLPVSRPVPHVDDNGVGVTDKRVSFDVPEAESNAPVEEPPVKDFESETFLEENVPAEEGEPTVKDFEDGQPPPTPMR